MDMKEKLTAELKNKKLGRHGSVKKKQRKTLSWLNS